MFRVLDIKESSRLGRRIRESDWVIERDSPADEEESREAHQGIERKKSMSLDS